MCVSRSLGHNTNGAQRVWSPKGCTATAAAADDDDDDDDDESRAKRKTHKTAGDCYLNKYGGESHAYNIYIRVYSAQRRRKGRCVYHVQRCAGRRVELSVRIYTHLARCSASFRSLVSPSNRIRDFPSAATLCIHVVVLYPAVRRSLLLPPPPSCI